MAKISLDLRKSKIKHALIMLCPYPQMNTYCQGKYIKTRRYQIECLECMKVHHTIHKHPLYIRLTKHNCDIL